jgi:hypothetical protein
MVGIEKHDNRKARHRERYRRPKVQGTNKPLPERHPLLSHRRIVLDTFRDTVQDVRRSLLALATRLDKVPHHFFDLELASAVRALGQVSLQHFALIGLQCVIDGRSDVLLIFPTLHGNLAQSGNKMVGNYSLDFSSTYPRLRA